MKKSISTHFALLFALLALAPIAVIFAIYSPAAIRELNTRALEDLHSLGSAHFNLVSLWMEEKSNDAERIALSHQVRNALRDTTLDKEELSGFLRSNLQEHGLLGIYLFDKDGNLRESEEREGHEVTPGHVKKLLDDTGKGTSFTWGGYMRRTEEAEDKHPTLFVTTPVPPVKETPGTVAVHLDLCNLRQVVVSLIGRKDGCSFLIDKKGRILTCLVVDPSCPYNEGIGEKPLNPQTGGPTLAVGACLSGGQGFSLQAYVNHAGERVMGAWGWLPELDMGIIMEINAQEFSGPTSIIKKRLWGLLLIIAAGIILISIFIGRKVSEPLLSLTETAKKMAAGNFDERSTIKSEDALGELAESLNTMAGSLQKEHAAPEEAYKKLATAIIKTLEAKDGFTATHTYMVATYAERFTEELGLSHKDSETIKNSATLHDIGKIALPSAILTKKGRLTKEEHDILKTHAEHSVKIIEGTGFLQEELPIILHHQEWFNGEGYPGGLKGTEIPRGARILAICDAYEAMTSKRPYHNGMSHKAALEEIRKGAGTQFDPELTEPFIRAMEKLLASTKHIYIPQLNKTVELT